MERNHEYETIEGTEPSVDEPHEARTIQHTVKDTEQVYMMTEIEDGVFVAWTTCRACSKHITACSCKDGPQMAEYMKKWRDERFERSIRHRKPSESKTKLDLQEAIDVVKAAKEQGVEPFDPDKPGFEATDEEKKELVEAVDDGH